jgi:hypothetical protein
LSYLDRLRTASYTSPSGVTSAFEFRSLSRALSHKAAIMELPQQNAADVQDLRMSAPRFSMQCIFTGSDYDLAADAYVTALSEYVTPQAPGILHHPRWGDINVMPLGIGQSENFTEEMGRATIEVEFIKISAVPYPLSATNAASGISADASIAMMNVATTVGAGLSPANALDSSGCQAQLTALCNGNAGPTGGLGAGSLMAAMAPISAFDPSVGPSLTSAISSFVAGLPAQISSGSSICNSVMAMMQVPSLTQLCPILTKVQSISNVIASLVSTTVNLPKTVAQAFTHGLMFFGAMAGQITAALSGGLSSRSDAVNASLAIQASLAGMLGAISADESSVPGYIAPPGVMSSLKDLANRASAMLMAQSFALATAHYMTLTQEHNLLTLSYTIFGDTSETHLNSLEAWNGFGGDMKYVIPIGTQVVWYA